MKMIVSCSPTLKTCLVASLHFGLLSPLLPLLWRTSHRMIVDGRFKILSLQTHHCALILRGRVIVLTFTADVLLEATPNNKTKIDPNMM